MPVEYHLVEVPIPEIKIYLEKTQKSKKIFEEAQKYVPGGVASPIRYCKPYPFYVTKGYGSRIWDVDGNEYIDNLMSYGAMTAGHRNPKVVEYIKKFIDEKFTMVGIPTPEMVELAKEITKKIPTMEMVRFCNSGLEATMHCVRLARAVTGRNKIIKIEGGYHGCHDYLLISEKPKNYAQMGPPDSPVSFPNSPGTPEEVVKLTLVVQFNDIDSLEKLLRKQGNEVAAIILEPILTSSGIILPKDDYLKEVRRLCDYYNILMILDEVKTGFNASMSAAHLEYGVEPDLVALSKAIGGGAPLAVFGGKREYMEEVAPVGPFLHFGTYNGNPLSVAAGLAAVKEVFTEDTQHRRFRLNEELCKGLNNALEDLKIKGKVICTGAMHVILFGLDEEPKNFREAFRCNKIAWYKYWIRMITQGVIPCGNAWFEQGFISAMHTKEDVDIIIEKAYEALKGVKEII